MASTDFNVWQEGTSPSWLLGTYGKGLVLVLGNVKDSFVDAARQAIKTRFPTLGPGDAVDAIAFERGLEQLGAETFAAFRERLAAAWDEWEKGGTAAGILDHLALYGLGDAEIHIHDKPGFPDWDLGNGSWARFVVLILNSGLVSEGTWGDGKLWGDGGTWGSNATTDQVGTVRRQVQTWKGAHAKCLGIIVMLEGEYWGDPGLWGDPGVWGGAECVW